MKVKISVRKILWQLLNKLPGYISENWVRNNIYINEQDLNRFTVKVANQQDEFEQGFRLLYECYLEQGYLSSTNQHSLRITKYHLMPSSTMFIVKDKNIVIATLTHVIDSKIGLPCEKAVDLSSIKSGNPRLAEISALAIKKGYRRQYSVMFALTRLAYHFSTHYAGVDAWVICVSSHIDLYYRALFFFKNVTNIKFKYHFVNKVSTSALYVKLNELPILFKYFYNDQKSSTKNLYEFYLQDWGKIFSHFPESVIRGATTPTLTVELINHFFKHQSNVWNELSVEEKTEVINAYYDERLLTFNDSLLAENVTEKRQSIRRLTNINCELVKYSDFYQEFSSGSIVNISSKGFLLRSDVPLEFDLLYSLVIQVSNNLKLRLSFRILREVSERSFACVVEKEDIKIWENYFNKVEDYCKSFVQPVLDTQF